MDRIAARNVAGPLLLLNFLMYFILLVFASWCMNRYIDGQTAEARTSKLAFLVLFIKGIWLIDSDRYRREWSNRALPNILGVSSSAWNSIQTSRRQPPQNVAERQLRHRLHHFHRRLGCHRSCFRVIFSTNMLCYLYGLNIMFIFYSAPSFRWNSSLWYTRVENVIEYFN